MNHLKKIFHITNISFSLDFLKDEYVDYLNAENSISIIIDKFESEMTGPNMWHLVDVLRS